MPHAIYIPFLFALGACVGSFLNVVVWRLPRGQSLVSPPSHCPKCQHPLAWFDNIPVFGWILLRGKCRYCREPISPKYPIFEFVTGAIFVFYYVMFFIFNIGPCSPAARSAADSPMPMMLLDFSRDWPMYALYMFLASSLLAASLIDAELFIIPLEIPWLAAGVGIVVHAIIDRPSLPGALSAEPVGGAMAAGATVGLLLSLVLWRIRIIPTSFPKGEPILEVDRPAMEQEIAAAKREGRELDYDLPPPYTSGEIRAEMSKEMLFLIPPLLLGGVWLWLTLVVPAVHAKWVALMQYHWLGGLLGALLGALVGGFVVWLTRILGTLGFGRVAMGLGDVHLMFGVGAIVGAGASTVAFFLAPFFGILIAIYRLVARSHRELPYGPYLSMATGLVMLFYCPIAAYLRPGIQGLIFVLTGRV